MTPQIASWAHHFAGALFNGLYQGLALAAVLWLGLKLGRRLNAATRHAARMVTLGLVAALPVLHLVPPATGGWRAAAPDRIGPDVPTTSGGDMDAASPFGKSDFPPGNQFAGTVHGSLTPVAENLDPLAGSSRLPRTSAAGTRYPSLPGQIADSPIAAATGEQTDLPRHSTATSVPSLAAPVWRTTVPATWSITLLGIVILVGAARLARLGLQFRMLHAVKRSGVPADGELARTWTALCREAHVRRPARLLINDQIHTPMAIGYRHPAVLLPARLVSQTDATGLEPILRHELAHVQRRDDWSNLMQQVIAAIFFYHPAVWWLSRRLTVDREIACDDHALARAASPRDYALFLTEFAGRSRGHDWIAAPAAWSSKSQLKERITMILDTKRNTSLRLARTSAGLLTFTTLATMAFALAVGPRLVLAEESAGAASATLAGPNHSADVVSPLTGDSATTLTSDVAVLKSQDSVLILPPSTTGTHSASSAQLAVLLAHGAPLPVEPPDAAPPKEPRPAPHPRPSKSVNPSNPPNRPDPPAARQESLEKRLERLERMLGLLGDDKRSLNIKINPDLKFDYNLDWKAHTDGDESINQKQEGRFEWHSDEHANWPHIQEHQIVIEKAMKEAEEQVKRATRDIERAAADAQRQARVDAQIALKHIRIEEPEVHERRALEEQRRVLEKQMRDLERQMSRLEAQMAKFDQLHEETEESDVNFRNNSDDQTDAPRTKEKKSER